MVGSNVNQLCVHGRCDECPECVPTSNLRVIEPFRSKDGVGAEVYKSKLGGKPVVVIEADNGTGDDAEVVLNVQEAHDLMLWLQCALSAETSSVETTERSCACIPMAPRPWKYCANCGGRIPVEPSEPNKAVQAGAEDCQVGSTPQNRKGD